jgi:purine nucleoside phosphorylase
MEVKLFGQWGLDAVGMSTVWETIALRHAGARVAGIALLSNLGSGLSPEPLSHEAVLKASHAAATKILRAVFTFAEDGAHG